MRRAAVAGRCAALVVALLALAAQADYPPAQDKYVNDYVRRLDDDTAQVIRAKLGALDQDTGVEMTVVVIDSVADHGTGDATLEQFATGLFNRWGVGKRERNDGVLLLVAIRDRALRIELGSGYGDAADAIAKDVIEREMVPHFKAGAYARGIQAGAESLASKARLGALPLRTGISAWLGSAAGAMQRFDRWPQAGAGLGVLLATLFGWRFYARQRARQCPQCKAEMRRLSDITEKRYLDAGEKLEEQLESVDYDVWQCVRCNATVKIPYRSWFSAYDACPQCRRRALRKSRRVLEPATYYAEGRELVAEDCAGCQYHSENTVMIPRKVQSQASSSSDSGSGSSFGGGSSSGGGASGRW